MARAKKAVAPKVEVVTITQASIEALNERNLKIAALAKELNALKAEAEKDENALLAKIKEGAVVENGSWIAAVDKAPGRCVPKWKDEAVLLAVQAGQAPGIYEETIKAKYPPKLVESLVITKIA